MLFWRAVVISILFMSLIFQGQVYCSENRDFTVMTLNAAHLPWPIKKNVLKRTKKLAKEIMLLNPRPDIVALQEMFSKIARIRVFNRIKSKYPYKCEDRSIGRLAIGVNSGQVIYSRYPIKKCATYHYRNFKGEENLAQKGVLGAKIKIKSQQINVFTTHLQAGGGHKIFRCIDRLRGLSDDITTETIRQRQLKELRAFVNRFTNKEKNLPKLLVGDLNIAANKDIDNYHNALDLVNGVDTFDSEKSTYSSSSWNGNSRIDYIWILDSEKSIPGLVGNSIITPHFDSETADHLAVIGDFIFQNSTGRVVSH